jgi:Bacterial regulatory proteins, tetR family
MSRRRPESRHGTDARGRPGRASVDRIAARGGVSKATIYKWWPNRTAVAIDAFLHQMMADAPVPGAASESIYGISTAACNVAYLFPG